MSVEDFKRFIPDTPEEISFIGSSIMRFGTAVTAIGAFQEDQTWMLISAGSTWVGHEIFEYFKLHMRKIDNEDK